MWPTIRFNLGNLEGDDERRFANFVSAFEGKSFQGLDEDGTDGYTYSGNTPVSLTGMTDFRLVQLKILTTGLRGEHK